jgi:phosphoglycolate phosphatase
LTILFDLDGVLVDSRTAFARCVNHALAAHGLPERPDAELHRFLGPPLHRTFDELAGAELADGCVASYRARYAEYGAAESTVFDGIPAALDALGTRHRLAVATSKPAPMAEALLHAVGLRDRFVAVHGPSLTARHEPKATTVARALPAAALVGDTRFDVEAARAHGLRAIGVTWGIGTPQELADADALVHAPGELEALL